MSDIPTHGPRFSNRRLRVGALALEEVPSDLAADCAVLSSGAGVPDHTCADGSLYLRNDGAAGSTLYVRIADAWSAIGLTALSGTDFGNTGLASDIVAESTTAAGVTVDGLLIKDTRIQVTSVTTGTAGITLKDNLASAFDVKEASNSYLVFCTTNSAESIATGVRLTTTDGVSSGTARVVGGIAISDPVASTAVPGTTETNTIFSHGTYTLPANSLKVGTVVRVRAGGLYTATTGSETHTFSVMLGGSPLATTGDINPADNDVFAIEFTFVCRATGGTGTVVGDGVCRSGARATASPATHMMFSGSAATSTMTVDTTASLVLGISVDRQASAADSDSMRLDYFHVEVIG